MILIVSTALVMVIGTLLSVAKIPINLATSYFILLSVTFLSILYLRFHKGSLLPSMLFLVFITLFGFLMPASYGEKIAWAMTHSLTPPTLSQFAVAREAALVGQGVFGAFLVNLLGAESLPVRLLIHTPTFVWITSYMIAFVYFFRGSIVMGALMVAAALTLSLAALPYFLLLSIGVILFRQDFSLKTARRLGLILLLSILINPFLLGVIR